MKRVNQKRSKKRSKKVNIMNKREYSDLDADAKISAIQTLIPIGLMYLKDELLNEVERMAGTLYSRTGIVRYGTNRGSVVLGDQRVGIDVPRLRNVKEGDEVPLEIYKRFHDGQPIEEAALIRVLKGISCKNYQEASRSVPEAFGLSSSTISRKFIKASAKKLKEFQNRDLSEYDFITMMMDGKTFSGNELILAIGITMGGEKVVLGFIESATENTQVVEDFCKSLLDRGMNIDEGLLVVLDGAKGLKSGVKSAFNKKVLFQRCQWHKRENVVGYMGKSEKHFLRKRLQRAYEKPDYNEAKKALSIIKRDLENRNQSAADSFKEGFDETLTLHKLGVFSLLGKSLKTTNCLESINAQVENLCGKVDYWQNSSQRQRWVSSALLDIEPRLRRIRGYRHLSLLRIAIKKELNIDCKELKKVA